MYVKLEQQLNDQTQVNIRPSQIEIFLGPGTNCEKKIFMYKQNVADIIIKFQIMLK